MQPIADKLDWAIASLGLLYSELVIAIGLLLLVVNGLVSKDGSKARSFSLAIMIGSALSLIIAGPFNQPVALFGGMLRSDSVSFYMRSLISFNGMLIVLLSGHKSIIKKPTEYFVLILA